MPTGRDRDGEPGNELGTGRAAVSDPGPGPGTGQSGEAFTENR
jgi:hypothetical protein